MSDAPAAFHGLNELISSIREHPDARFYRNLWAGEQSFEGLPCVSRKHLRATPLDARRYKVQKGMVKIVGSGDEAFLSEWSFSDIAHEAYAPVTTRPMVLMKDPYDAVEKAMWCYENNVTPIVPEYDSDIAVFAALRYRIDSLITDESSLSLLVPFFSTVHEPISTITVIGTSFSPSLVAPFERFAKRILLVLALPETGVIADAEWSANPKFIVRENCKLEPGDEIVLTKLADYPTPLIKYRTGIPASILR